MKNMKKKVVKKFDIESKQNNDFREGKALLNISLGLLLVAYSFGVLSFSILAAVAGALFCLKGLVQLLKK